MRKFLLSVLIGLNLTACAQIMPAAETVRAALPAATPSPVPPPRPGWTRLTLNGGGGQPSISIDPTNSQVVYVTTDNGGIVKTTDGGETWAAINHNIGNRMLSDSELDPLDAQVLYVLAEVFSESPSYADEPVNGELYRTRDGGQTWEVVYAQGMGADGRVFGIVQWPSTRNLLIPFDAADVARFDADDDQLSDVIYVGGWDDNDPNPDKRGGVWRSTDEGATFTQLGLNDKNIWALRADPRDPQKLYAATFGDGLWVSTDGGTTWASWRERIPLPMISDVAIDAVSGALYVTTNVFYTQYASTDYQAVRGIYKSTDDGQTFTLINTGLDLSAQGYQTLLIDRTDPTGQTLITGNFRADTPNVYQSTNGGQSWTVMPLKSPTPPGWFKNIKHLWALEQAADGTVYATSWRGIFRYNRAEGLWEVKSVGLGNISIQSIAQEPNNPSVIYLGILDSEPYKSVNWGATWEPMYRGFASEGGEATVGAGDLAVAPTNPQIVYATGIGPSGQAASAVLKSTDAGKRWEQIAHGLPPTNADQPTWVARAIAVSAGDEQVAYVALDILAGEGQVYKTLDGGASWQLVLTVPERARDLTISATTPETVILATASGGVFVSDTAGQNWREARLPTENLIYSVAVFPTDPSRILVGVNVLGAYLSRDGARSWVHIFDETQVRLLNTPLALSEYARERYQATVMNVRFDPTSPETLYLGHNPRAWMGLGIIRTIDGGQTWRLFADDAKFQTRSVQTFEVGPTGEDLWVGAWELYYFNGGH